MSRNCFAWGAVTGAILLALASFVPLAARAQGEPLARVRRQIQAGDFENALARLSELQRQAAPGTEHLRLQALAWLGKALTADAACEEPSMRALLVAKLLRGIPVLREKARSLGRQEPLLDEAETAARAYLPLVVEEPRRVAETKLAAGDSVERACDAARAALTRAGRGDADREAAGALVVWCELVRFLLAHDTASLLGPTGLTSAFTDEQLKSLRDFSATVSPVSSEERLHATFSLLTREAAESTTSELPLAVADCLTLFCAATGRSIAAYGSRQFWKLTHLRRERPGAGPEEKKLEAAPPRDPAVYLKSPAAAALLKSDPEGLVMPLYALAVHHDTGHDSAGAHYGLFRTLAFQEASGALPALEGWLKHHPGEGAFVLEKARLSLARDDDAEAGLSSILDGIRKRKLTRPVLLSFPAEVRPLWMQSRYVRAMSSSIALPYHMLFQLIDSQAARLKRAGKSNLPLLSVRLRLADLLLQSDYLPDVYDGMKEAKQSLTILKLKAASDEQRAQAELYERRLMEIVRRTPGSTTKLVVTSEGVRPYRYPHDSVLGAIKGAVSANRGGISMAY